MTASPLPFKLRFLHALTDALKQITPANGYIHDLSDFAEADEGTGTNITRARVFRGRQWFGDDDPIPMVSVLEGINPADELFEPPADSATGAYDWPLLIQGFVDDDRNNPTDPAYVFMADVRRRVAVEKKRTIQGARMVDPFGLGQSGPNKVTSVTIGPGIVRPADDVSAKAYFWFSLFVRVIDNAEQPYA